MPSGARSISCTNSSVSGAVEETNRLAVIGPAMAVGWSKGTESSTSSGPLGVESSDPFDEPAWNEYACRCVPFTQSRSAGLHRGAVEGQPAAVTVAKTSVNWVCESGKPFEMISPTALPLALIAEDHARGLGGRRARAEDVGEVRPSPVFDPEVGALLAEHPVVHPCDRGP